MPTWLAVALGMATVVSAGVALFVAFIALKIRGDFAVFELRIVELLNAKLGAYLPLVSFQMYSEAHAREHRRLERVADALARRDADEGREE